MSTLEVNDEGEYWEHRDWRALERKTRFSAAVIDSQATELGRFGLSAEAAEDPEILIRRIERIANLVQRTMSRPSEHPPVERPATDDWAWSPESEAVWDASYREQRRKEERLIRAIEKRLAAGEDHHSALENAMRDEGLVDLPGEDACDFREPGVRSVDDEPDESWRASLEDDVGLDGPADAARQVGDHPLVECALQLQVDLHQLLGDVDESRSGHVLVLLSGAGDLMGGLAQATSGLVDGEQPFDVDPLARGLAIVQLKRALRGAAYASGALFALSREDMVGKDRTGHLHEAIDQLREETFALLQQFRGE
jgi:hypothetical protein